MLSARSNLTLIDDLLARICTKLQISPSQHSAAEDHYLAIGKWLGDKPSPLAAWHPQIYSQGSLRIGTTVKPWQRQEFDLDLVCEFSINPRLMPNPTILLDMVEARLRQNEVYKSILERKKRCIRVNYANSFHLDILPACPDTSKGRGCLLVPDRHQGWKPSNPKGYAEWIEQRAYSYAMKREAQIEPLPDHETAQEKAPLKQIIQLIKRWRDVTYANTMEQAPISIVLTTLSGQHYMGETSICAGLTGILQRIVAQTRAEGHFLEIRNPANPDEVLSEKWGGNPHLYASFAQGIQEFNGAWNGLCTTNGIPPITKALERLFGEEVAKTVIAERAESMQTERNSGRLQVQSGTGLLGAIGATKGIPVRANTFHGA